jgi:hypothetical protein
MTSTGVGGGPEALLAATAPPVASPLFPPLTSATFDAPLEIQLLAKYPSAAATQSAASATSVTLCLNIRKA